MLDKKQQTVFYDPGVGTFVDAHSRLKKWSVQKLQAAFGFGVQRNMMQGYQCLMQHYQRGDHIYLFGFSRGAYTARALAGFIYRWGLLYACHTNIIPYCVDLYNRKRFGDIANIRDHFARQCQVYFIGVWDTVGSIGSMAKRYAFYDVTLNPTVQYGYHAISIDEKRKKFPVLLWQDKDTHPQQTIEQVWFAGVHSDVGGGYPEAGLADISLAWMLAKAGQAGLRTYASDVHIEPDPAAKLHTSRKGLWKLWQTAPRKIPENALIHQSVHQRMQAIPSYQPRLPSKYRMSQ